MKYLLIVLIIIEFTQSITSKLIINEEFNAEWQVFKRKFNKSYTEIDELARKAIWIENIKYIQHHNVKHDLGQHSHSLGINEFSDLTYEEFEKLYLLSKNIEHNDGIDYLPPMNIDDLPDSVDWRTKGYVTNVKNQGQCGSCWAFSTTGSLEGQHFRRYKVLQNISEQQLVDCASKNYGCNGGWMNIAFEYISNNGIESENDYPYQATQGNCVYDKSKVVAKCKGFQNIKRNNEKDLAIAVATVGPISVAIDVGYSFQHYRQGVYYEPSCNPLIQNHAVLVVGYGVEDGNKYWLVKNSWGSSWGMNGYIKMSKDRNNNCGIATTASFPIV